MGYGSEEGIGMLKQLGIVIFMEIRNEGGLGKQVKISIWDIHWRCWGLPSGDIHLSEWCQICSVAGYLKKALSWADAGPTPRFYNLRGPHLGKKIKSIVLYVFSLIHYNKNSSSP